MLSSSSQQVTPQKSLTFEERTAKLAENKILGYYGEEFKIIPHKDFVDPIFVQNDKVTPLEIKNSKGETKYLVAPIKVVNSKLNEYLG